MDWLKKLKKSPEEQLPPENIASDSIIICLDAFKSHWLQICEVINATSTRPAFIKTDKTKFNNSESLKFDDIDTVRSLLDLMVYLLAEEQASDQILGPILKYTITQDIFQKLADWWEKSTIYKEQIMLILLKIYEVMISQAQHSLLHHKQLVTPMLKILSSNDPKTEEMDGHIVLLLNLLCVWINRDPTLLEVFFNASADHGPAKFLIFSLLIEYIHRDGTVGQQARDALLLCMALSAENETVANYIVDFSNFCPVLATGLSALYSTLPRHIEIRADDWHCLQKSDWSTVPELTNFMNSFEFCNSVIEVSHRIVSDQLLEFFYNGFLVSVFGPSLHKTSADEVVVTTVYLNLFLRSVTAPALMRSFLQFLLTHRHDSSLIINTLIQRIASNNRLALVSLSLLRTLVDLNCEDLMLQLVFRYLLPCQHILASQRRAIRDVDIYNASASRFLALTPAACVSDTKIKDEDLLLPVKSQAVENFELPKVSGHPTPAFNNTSPAETNLDHSNGGFHDLTPPDSMHATAPVQSLFYQKSTTSGMSITSSNVNHAMSKYTVNEDLSVTISVHPANAVEPTIEINSLRSRTITNPNTMAEFGPDLNSQLELNTSYMDYLEDAKCNIDQCREACSSWSSRYDGVDPINIEGIDSESEQKDQPASAALSATLMASAVVDSDKDFARIDDSLTSSSTDTAMKALSATFQALNITALALNQNKEGPSIKIPPANLSEPRADTTEHITGDAVLTSTVQTRSSPSQEQRVASEPLVTSLEPKESLKLENEAVDEDSINNTLGSLETESESRGRSTTITSSVDEFFRSLMDIVPAQSKDKINNESKKFASRASDEDIESGIEISSEVDQQISSKETSDKENGKNEETISQSSLNTDEIDKDGTKLNPGEIQGYNRTYSFADDADSEFDDTLSIASSSFYEANDEYSPTDISVTPSFPLKMHGLPYTGPLIGNLFAKLDQMVSNSLYENLLLTGIVARLAVYPQPLLRSFLLNTHMVFHPSVKSLYQVLNSARTKIDAYAEEINDFKALVCRAQKYLLARGTYPFSADAKTRNNVENQPMPVPSVKTRVLGGMFRRRKMKEQNKKKYSLSTLETLLERRPRTTSIEVDEENETDVHQRGESASMFYVKKRVQQREKEERKMRELRTKNAVYASIVLAEFLKELAAIAQEHAVASFSK